MKPMRTLAVLSAALVFTAVPALAQRDGGTPPDGRGVWGGPGGFPRHAAGAYMARRAMRPGHMHHARMRDPIAGMLDHQTFLRLTPAQVNNLISIDDKLHDDNKPLVSRLMTMRSGVRRDMAGRGAERDSASSDARTGQRDSAEAIVRTIRHNVWRATSAADAVLTPEQLNSAAMLDRSAHRSERSHPGMGPGSRRGPGTDRGR